MKMIATFVALALVGAACGRGAGGGGIPPAPEGFSKSEWATYVAEAAIPRPTPDAKATAMAKARQHVDMMDSAGAALCKDNPRCFSPEEQEALRPSLVLKDYAHLIGDAEAEARADALYQETKAAWEAAHVPPPQPIIVVRPPLLPPPVSAPDTFELDRLKHKVNDLCQEIGESVC